MNMHNSFCGFHIIKPDKEGVLVRGAAPGKCAQVMRMFVDVARSSIGGR